MPPITGLFSDISLEDCMAEKTIMILGELSIFAGAVLSIVDVYYLSTLDKMTQTLEKAFSGEQVKSLCFFDKWIINRLQKGIKITDSEIAKEMTIRSNSKKILYSGLLLVFTGTVLKIIGTFLHC